MPRGADWPLGKRARAGQPVPCQSIGGRRFCPGRRLDPLHGRDERPSARSPATTPTTTSFRPPRWTPTMRHSWNPDNTLAQWQERFRKTAFPAAARDGRAERNRIPACALRRAGLWRAASGPSGEKSLPEPGVGAARGPHGPSEPANEDEPASKGFAESARNEQDSVFSPPTDCSIWIVAFRLLGC